MRSTIEVAHGSVFKNLWPVHTQHTNGTISTYLLRSTRMLANAKQADNSLGLGVSGFRGLGFRGLGVLGFGFRVLGVSGFRGLGV